MRAISGKENRLHGILACYLSKYLYAPLYRAHCASARRWHKQRRRISRIFLHSLLAPAQQKRRCTPRAYAIKPRMAEQRNRAARKK